VTVTARQEPFKSRWGSEQNQKDWLEQLELTGLENVRLRLNHHTAGSGGSIAIGTQTSITKGFIEEWVAWHDQRKQAAEAARYAAEEARHAAEAAHRERVAWWTKAAALGAIAAAVFTLIGAVAAVGQAVVAWMALPKPPQ